jgi:hypothetical protein
MEVGEFLVRLSNSDVVRERRGYRGRDGEWHNLLVHETSTRFCVFVSQKYQYGTQMSTHASRIATRLEQNRNFVNQNLNLAAPIGMPL